ncbi:MAG TPA: hypothetical protein VI583_14680 [Cyclobacteriaceae bacterium]|nr:hypothetical protein [Cyclobacteriaceae bacterium]
MATLVKNPFAIIFEEYARLDKRVFFILVCLITFLLLYLKKNLIESRIAAFEILEERGEMGLFHVVNAFQYFSIPVIYLYKFTVIAFLVSTGCFAWGYKVVFSRVWQLVMLSECVFFFAELVKIGWFLTVSTDPDIWEVRAFYPLSLMGLFDYTQVQDSWHYPLKSLNIFEAGYWVVLILGVQHQTNKRVDISAYIVLSFYVFWFFIWLGFYIIVYK